MIFACYDIYYYTKLDNIKQKYLCNFFHIILINYLIFFVYNLIKYNLIKYRYKINFFFLLFILNYLHFLQL